MSICRKVEVMAAHGPVSFDYVISTPKETSAKTIDPALPTVLLLHTVFFGKEIFHHQFTDPSLRRFNLVAVDLLCHGDTVAAVPEDYNQKMAAADIVTFMDAINLPPCIVVGVAMGAMFGMQLAVSYPERVRGLFLISPLCTPETPDAAAGRQQISDAWVDAYDKFESGVVVDPEALEDSVFGALQLGFNSSDAPFVRANITITLVQCRGRQAVQPLDTITGTCTIFLIRTGYEDSELQHLAQSRIPVALVHGTADVAYQPEYYAEFADQLKRCGVNVRMHEIDGAPHFANTTHYAAINPLVSKLVIDSWDSDKQSLANVYGIASPFEARLRAAGYRESHEDTDDEE